ncbi:ribosomal RNA-processing protein 8 [Diorhabda sublineata]|uniref:ribosomal RNA-processing protein 8 n=1 Tax=Diorhabda sublineata TaxID=1163346 RepID=UPI0024E13939|nr:ribosomal RNA-processing protein 8 [Diorhabda sublineata]
MKTFNSVKWDADADNNIFDELFKKKKRSKSRLIEKAKKKLKQTPNFKVNKKISKLANKLNLQSDDTINLIKSPIKKVKKKKQKQKGLTKNDIDVSHLNNVLNCDNKNIQEKNNYLVTSSSDTLVNIKTIKKQKLKKLHTVVNKLTDSNVETEEVTNLLKSTTNSKKLLTNKKKNSQIGTNNDLTGSTTTTNKNKANKLEKQKLQEKSAQEIITKSKKRRMRRLKKLIDTNTLTEQIKSSSNPLDSNSIKKNKKGKVNSSNQEITKSKKYTQEDNVEKNKKRNRSNVFKDTNNKIVETIPDNTKKLKNKSEKTSRRIEINNQLPKRNLRAIETSGSNRDKKKEKFYDKLKYVLEEVKETKPKLSLRQRMMEKLKAARFRFINEQIYTTDSKEAQKLFQTDPDAFKAYHDGYRKQVKMWPLNPLDVIIKSIKKMPHSHVVADFGCGDARLSKSVDQKVHSFDLVAVNDTVIECDMCKVPLDNDSVDVAVFCLSLMGTNLKDYLLEANRVLKVGGILKIAEVESRFENIDDFIKGVSYYGFKNSLKDLSNNLFYFLDFKKERPIKHKNKLPTIGLHPCLYKKR